MKKIAFKRFLVYPIKYRFYYLFMVMGQIDAD